MVGVAKVSLLVVNHLQRLAELQQRGGQASQTAQSEGKDTQAVGFTLEERAVGAAVSTASLEGVTRLQQD